MESIAALLFWSFVRSQFQCNLNGQALNTNIQSFLRIRHSGHFVEILFFKLNRIECVENVLLITVDYRRRWIITIFQPSRSMHSRQMVDSLRWVCKPSTIKRVILIARAGVFNGINMTAVTFNTCILYCFACPRCWNVIVTNGQTLSELDCTERISEFATLA